MVRPTEAGGDVTRYTSHVPAAIDALVALVRTGLSNLDVLVKDGAWTSQETKQDIVCIGWSGFIPGYQFPSKTMSEQLGGADVSLTAVAEGLGPSIREVFVISCCSISRVGSTDGMPEARRRAYANMNAVGGMINPPWLEANVIKATMGTTSSLHQEQERRGALAVVTFSVEAEAYAQQ
jgi:hypothetical protein